ncbi:hypothetical protein [Exiguobacterium sp. S22-S28]|uniref:hypothetical protein n=1 Tax=Exiguobacterium sp. S22-S28 TaxID=3342768 RepID=UPI00372CEDFF
MNKKSKLLIATASLFIVTFLIVYNLPKNQKLDVNVEKAEAEVEYPSDKEGFGESVADKYQMTDEEQQATDFLNDGYLDDVEVRAGDYYKLLDVLNTYVESYLYLSKQDALLKIESHGDYGLSVPDISGRDIMSSVDMSGTDRTLYMDVLDEQLSKFSSAQYDFLEEINLYNESLEDNDSNLEELIPESSENYQLMLEYEKGVRAVLYEYLANL